ncbi:MAG: PQQ-dependent sugar dehydrogenase [Solirubrobacteraceae bacterium]
MALAVIGCLPAAGTAQAEGPTLAPVGGVFTKPTYVTAPPGDSHRLFVVEQGGTIQLLRDGVRATQPFLAVPGVLNSGERGLLSMAFAPDYAASGRFYVYYVATGDGHIQIDEFRRAATDPDRADLTTRRPVLAIAHPNGNHNGGQLQFGPDGFLYAGTGDGGGASNPNPNPQNLGSLLGKMLRIDPLRRPASGAAYAIPAGNPFVGRTGAQPEIWQYGLRNPFRFSFDRQTGDKWIGDVGQSNWEEVDFNARGTGAGTNWGWNMCEGKHRYPISNPDAACVPTTSTLPVSEYDHSGGRCSITGGYVARDPALGSLVGSYLFGDYCGGQIYARSPSTGVVTDLAPLNVPYVVSFGEDSCGHVFVVSQADGSVSRLQTSATTPCRDAVPPPQPPVSDPAVRIDRRDVRVSSRGYLRVRMRCSIRASQRCQGSVALRRGALIVARASFSATPGQLIAPRMRLTARGRALVRHRHRLAVQAAARSSDASGRSVRRTARSVLVA